MTDIIASRGTTVALYLDGPKPLVIAIYNINDRELCIYPRKRNHMWAGGMNFCLKTSMDKPEEWAYVLRITGFTIYIHAIIYVEPSRLVDELSELAKMPVHVKLPLDKSSYLYEFLIHIKNTVDSKCNRLLEHKYIKDDLSDMCTDNVYGDASFNVQHMCNYFNISDELKQVIEAQEDKTRLNASIYNQMMNIMTAAPSTKSARKII